jgi:hypothetical protein
MARYAAVEHDVAYEKYGRIGLLRLLRYRGEWRMRAIRECQGAERQKRDDSPG